jgi:hypothetical protein
MQKYLVRQAYVSFLTAVKLSDSRRIQEGLGANVCVGIVPSSGFRVFNCRTFPVEGPRSTKMQGESNAAN